MPASDERDSWDGSHLKALRVGELLLSVEELDIALAEVANWPPLGEFPSRVMKPYAEGMASGEYLCGWVESG